MFLGDQRLVNGSGREQGEKRVSGAFNRNTLSKRRKFPREKSRRRVSLGVVKPTPLTEYKKNTGPPKLRGRKG
jgi:hypothetical protein